MNSLRNLSSTERAVITALLKAKPEAESLISSMDTLGVKQMNDGGMGSLTLVPMGLEHTPRMFGKQLILGEFTDLDGVLVSVAVNVDREGQLYELDVWKVNFSPLLAWPDTADIRIAK